MEKAAKSNCSQIIRRLLVFSIIDNNQLFHRTKIVPLTGRVNCRSHLDYQGTRNPRPIRYDQREKIILNTTTDDFVTFH